MKKPFKSGGDFVRNGNGEPVLMTRAQALKMYKKSCRTFGWTGLKKFTASDRGEYWAASSC